MCCLVQCMGGHPPRRASLLCTCLLPAVQLGLEFDLRSHKGAQPLCATGELESLDVYQGVCASSESPSHLHASAACGRWVLDAVVKVVVGGGRGEVEMLAVLLTLGSLPLCLLMLPDASAVLRPAL